MLELKQAGYSVGKIIILKNINAQFVDGAFNVILGPNGAGKSTLLKLATGILTPSVGEVFLDDKNGCADNRSNNSYG